MKKKSLYIYCGLLIFSSILFLITINTISKNFYDAFLVASSGGVSGDDRFMDFFNSIRDARDGRVYDQRGVIYPAFINCFFWGVSVCLPFLDEGWGVPEMHASAASHIAYIAFIALCVLFYWIILSKAFPQQKKMKLLLFSATFLSMPMLWALERGNVLIASVLCVISFILLKDHENKKIRELGFVLLAVATAIKIYPALFILLLLFEKRYKELIRTAIYIFVLLILPFVFYDGYTGLAYVAKSIFRFVDFHNIKESQAYATSLAEYLKRFQITLPSAAILLTYVFYVILLIFSKKTYAKCLMITLIILNMSGSQIIYNSLYLLIPIMALFKEKELNIFDLLIFIVLGFTQFLNAIPLSFLKTDYLLWNNSIFYLIVTLSFLVGVNIVVERCCRKPLAQS